MLTMAESLELYEKLLRDTTEAEFTKIARELCKKDLFFLLTQVCKRKDVVHPWLYDRIKEVEANPNGYLDLWSRGHYKAVCIDYIVPTPDGYKKHGELKEGDYVFGSDGKPCKVIATTPIFTDGKCYEIEFSDGTKVKCGSDHLWVIEVKSSKRVKGTFKRGVSNGHRLGRVQKILSTEEIFKHPHVEDNRLAIKTSTPLNLPDKDLPIDPYVFGVWLGDGCKTSCAIIGMDMEIFEEIEYRGYNLGNIFYHKNNKAITRNILGFAKCLREVKSLGCKHIPISYLRSSYQQRLDLLRGLMDTDGHCNVRGTATFVNTNEILVDGVYELACSLGMNPRKRKHKMLYNGKDYYFYHVSFQAYKENSPFLLKRKTDRCNPGVRKNNRRFIVGCREIASVPISCIQVDSPDGCYLISKSFIPTHNSTIITFGKTIQDVLNDPNIKVVIFSHTRIIAKDFLKQIKTEFETNSTLKRIFPDILYNDPVKDSPKWSLDIGLRLKRTSNSKEETIEAHGLIDGQPTGKHYNLMVYDDIITEVSVNTQEQIDKATQAWELSLNLGEPGCKIRYIGTRYHYADTYTTIMERNAAEPRIRLGVIENEPTLWSKEYLVKRRQDMGPYIYACLTGDTLILMGDFTFRRMEEVEVGEEVIGWERNSNNDAVLIKTKVLAVESRMAETVESIMNSGNKIKHTPEHLWWTGRVESVDRKEYSKLGYKNDCQKQLCQLVDINKIDKELSIEDVYYAGYVAGFLDADGSITGGTPHFYQGLDRNKYIHEFLTNALAKLKINTNQYIDDRKDFNKSDDFLVGGREEKIRLLCLCPRFAKRYKLVDAIIEHGSGYFGKASVDKLVSQESIGIQKVWSLQTETGNYFANGYASKNSQILLDPAAEQNAVFKETWLRYYGSKDGWGKYNRYIVVDPANAKNKKSDYTAIVVFGIGEDQNYYIIDVVRDRLSLTERTRILFDLYREYRPIRVGYEAYSKDADVDHIQYVQKQEQFRFDIIPLKGTTISKRDRISKLVPLFEQGRVYLPFDREILRKDYQGKDYYPIKIFKDEEYLTFPFCVHDDMLDAMSRMLDPDLHAKPPMANGMKIGYNKPQFCKKRDVFAVNK